ncbi:MAG: hypothetical protein M1815_002935 [Lichina confinis]|nr:MAG: hypothetical protein M1815_002935 [Lichina confinis]
MSNSVNPTADGHADQYDHEILLVDGTSRPSSPPEADTTGHGHPPSQTLNDGSGPRTSGTNLSRKWTLKEELARRKYAKWSEERFNGDEEAALGADGRPETSGETGSPERAEQTQGPHAAQHSKLLDSREQSEIDVLHENQRGAFACGVPLYSTRSLLPLDPAPWTNAAYKDSLVDITNAQPPDPTWEWAWRSWYVDMSGDVDEEGWQYSFAFSPRFPWHGTHLWFHSFARRRRWLRKRVKPRRSPPDSAIPGAERSSIRSAQSQSRDHSRTRGSQNLGGQRQSYGTIEQNDYWKSIVHGVRDIDSLMAVLRTGRIDREKVEAVSAFLEHGEVDMTHLADQMPEILSLFIFQASRRQLLAKLVDAFATATDDLKDDIKGDDKTNDPRRRKVHNLEKTLRVADDEVKKLEYWSDVKEMTHEGETKGSADPAQGWGDEWRGIDRSSPPAGGSPTRRDESPPGKPSPAAETPRRDKSPDHSQEKSQTRSQSPQR